MTPLRFWLPMNGREQEILIPGEYVERIMLPAAEHEAGHIVVAHHLNARVLGISVVFIPEIQGMLLQALYAWKDWPIETQCIVKAAGPAADILFVGALDQKGATLDLIDIEALTGTASLEPFLEQAKKILAIYPDEFGRVTKALRRSMETEEDRTLGTLPDGRTGALLLNEDQLLRCLAPNADRTS